MAMFIEYENAEEAQLRLDRSVVIYDGELVYVDHIRKDDDGKWKIQVYDLPLTGEKGTRKLVSSAKFNFEPFELGYINPANLEKSTRYSTYYTRAPVRKYKQGLNSENTTIIKPQFPFGQNKYGFLEFRELTAEKGFVDCFKGNYPSLQETLVTCKKYPERMLAFDRNFAVYYCDATDLYYLYYKAEIVGRVDNGIPILGNKFKYLQQVLDIAMKK